MARTWRSRSDRGSPRSRRRPRWRRPAVPGREGGRRRDRLDHPARRLPPLRRPAGRRWRRPRGRPGHGPVLSRLPARHRRIWTRRRPTIRRSSSTSSPATSTRPGRRSSPRAGRPTSRRRSSSTTTRVSTGCGNTSSTVGPFYCPRDRKVYLDLPFLDQLQKELGAPGDFARAYVIAHEIGHHVQNLLGVMDDVDHSRQESPDDANELSVRLELQADCLAGIWGHSAYARGDLLESGRPRGRARTPRPRSATTGSSSNRAGRPPRGVHARHVSAAGQVVPRRLRQRRPHRLRHLRGRRLRPEACGRAPCASGRPAWRRRA